jgi:hypothetical protein
LLRAASKTGFHTDQLVDFGLSVSRLFQYWGLREVWN